MPDDARPVNRQEFVEMLGELRRQGALDAGDEAALIRQYDEVLQEVGREKAQLLPEYERRCRDDGKEAADVWLTEAAGAMGRKHGDAMRRIIDSIPALTADGR